MSLQNIRIPSALMPLLLAVFFVFCGNFVLLIRIWHDLSAIHGLNSSFAFTIPFFLLSVFYIGITLLSARRLLKPLFACLIVLSAFLTYAMYNYGVVFDKNMIINIVETNPAEASSYASWTLLLWVVLLGVIPAALLIMAPIHYPSRRQSLIQKGIGIGIALIIILMIAVFHFKDYASFIRNNPTLRKDIVPTYALDAVYSYTKKTYFASKAPYTQIGLNALQDDPDIGEKKELVVLIVGETQRSMNYELNGYNRPTNSYTKKQDVISFRNTTSCGTATAVSVPCMFSNLTKDHYNRDTSYNQDGLLEVAKRSGVYVLWLDNDSGCKDTCEHVDTIDLRLKYQHDTEQCVGDGCHDSIFLSELPEQLDKLPDSTSLIVIHLMGSHGPTYFNRYPADHTVFKPDCRRSDIQNCTHEQLINTYDNTILYSDYVLSGIIDILKKYSDRRNPALIFMSDHGESLGEKGLYLHGMPYAVAPAEQTHIPFITWMTDDFAKDRGLDLACVRKELVDRPYSHDNMFHTVLGLLAVGADVYKPEMDVFTPCRTGTPDED